MMDNIQKNETTKSELAVSDKQQFQTPEDDDHIGRDM
jgi:hypothetical protein